MISLIYIFPKHLKAGAFVDKCAHSAGHDCFPDEPPDKPSQNHWLTSYVGPPTILLPDNQKLLSCLQSIPYSFARLYTCWRQFAGRASMPTLQFASVCVYTLLKCTLSGLLRCDRAILWNLGPPFIPTSSVLVRMINCAHGSLYFAYRLGLKM